VTVPPEDAARGRALASLSPREKDCLRLVFANHSSKEIARRLGISQTSVDTHLRHARAKLGLRDRYDAARRLQSWEQGERAAPPPATSPPAAAEPATPPPRPRGRLLLPPLEELSFPDRLLLVVGCAIFAALVFGLLLPAFAAL
jgi:DNA-binding CsgD family transcriptional regulator